MKTIHCLIAEWKDKTGFAFKSTMALLPFWLNFVFHKRGFKVGLMGNSIPFPYVIV